MAFAENPRRPGHFYEPGAMYFITTNLKARQRLFANKANVGILLEDLNFYRHKFSFKILAYVVMPDHFHCIIWPSLGDFERFVAEERRRGGKYADEPARYYLSKIMEDLKKHVANAIRKRLGLRRLSVWQEGFFDEPIRDRDSFVRAAGYVHNNPVAAGLVGHPADYLYSSYRQWFLGEQGLVPIDQASW